jgi:TRAP-type mannitol/chloroaromatic compound transport system permease small subunit
MAGMGYLLYPAIWSGNLGEKLMVARALVFLGFTILLIRGIIEIIRGPSR